MTTPRTNDSAFESFRAKLAEMFMFDQADLDFGIYRIMNAKRTEISKFLDSKKLTLLQMQQLMGRLNDISLMMPFLKSYKGPLNEILGYLQQYPDRVCAPSIQSIKDIMVWSGFLLDKALWSPISHRPTAPPISHFSFTSDAAGVGGGEKVRR
jgi:hypothetical protein